MTYDDHNSAGAAPARAPSDSLTSQSPLRVIQNAPPPPPQEVQEYVPGPHYETSIPNDLRVPWGLTDILIFVGLGILGGVVITWGLAQITVRLFGLNPKDVFGDNMTTAKSVVVLISQALLDAGTILYLYLMVLMRTPQPFWRTIGWREMRPGEGTVRSSATQYLAGGAVLALIVTFAGSFFSSKETLPIEQLLQARVSMLLFAVLGVLVAPLVEETIFRGFLYPVIARRLGIAAGVVITGTLFGLTHAVQLWGGWGQIALLIMVGVVLTGVRAKTGTVAASYFVHLGYNGLQLIGYVVYLIGGARH